MIEGDVVEIHIDRIDSNIVVNRGVRHMGGGPPPPQPG